MSEKELKEYLSTTLSIISETKKPSKELQQIIVAISKYIGK